MFIGNKPRSHSSSAEEDDEKFINVMTFDEVTWDNSMWKMETSKAMAFLGTKLLKIDHYLINIFKKSKGNLGCNRQHHGQNIHPTENHISMNLLQMS